MTIVQFPYSGDWNGPRDLWVKDSIYRLIESSIDQTSVQLPPLTVVDVRTIARQGKLTV